MLLSLLEIYDHDKLYGAHEERGKTLGVTMLVLLQLIRSVYAASILDFGVVKAFKYIGL